MKEIYNIHDETGIILHIMSDIELQLTQKGYIYKKIYESQPKGVYQSFQYMRGEVEYVQVLTHFEIEW